MAGRDFFIQHLPPCRDTASLFPRQAKTDMPESRSRIPVTYLSTFPMGRQAEKATGMEESSTHPAREMPSSHKSCRISA